MLYGSTRRPETHTHAQKSRPASAAHTHASSSACPGAYRCLPSPDFVPNAVREYFVWRCVPNHAGPGRSQTREVSSFNTTGSDTGAAVFQHLQSLSKPCTTLVAISTAFVKCTTLPLRQGLSVSNIFSYRQRTVLIFHHCFWLPSRPTFPWACPIGDPRQLACQYNSCPHPLASHLPLQHGTAWTQRSGQHRAELTHLWQRTVLIIPVLR
jgi:hypothetical protein